MIKFVFVTGMFRSGTTLMARMLNSHPQIAFASDPYFPIFKAFRNAVIEQMSIEGNIDYSAPLDDYYYYPEKQDLMEKIQDSSLDLPINNIDLSALRKTVANAARPYSPMIEHYLDDLGGETFTEIFRNGLNIIKRAYGSENTKLLGFKEVWTDEFAGHILKSFPEAKVIHIIRDPRAVVASNHATNERYPILFLARQWRKISTFSWVHSQPFFPYRDRVLPVQYEKLISHPMEETRKICEFLGIDFDRNLVDPSSFVDGEGKPWVQNSYHFEGTKQFNVRSLDKWRKTLSETMVGLIENLCCPEMLSWGYDFEVLKHWDLDLNTVFSTPGVEAHELAGWIRSYSLQYSMHRAGQMALEFLRAKVLTGNGNVSEKNKKALCLNVEFFNYARKLLNGSVV